MRQDFLHAIADNPLDDAPRLLFADWLSDRDDPQGEFIRVQCRLAHLPADAPERGALEQTERLLLHAHEGRWTAPCGLSRQRWLFRRGFPDDIELTPRELVRHVGPLLDCYPMAQIRLLVGGPLEELRHCEEMSRLRCLSLSYCFIGDTRLATLFLLARLDGLRILRLDHNFLRNVGAEMLVRAPSLNHLQLLDLRSNNFNEASRELLRERFPGVVRL